MSENALKIICMALVFRSLLQEVRGNKNFKVWGLYPMEHIIYKLHHICNKKKKKKGRKYIFEDDDIHAYFAF